MLPAVYPDDAQLPLPGMSEAAIDQYSLGYRKAMAGVTLTEDTNPVYRAGWYAAQSRMSLIATLFPAQYDDEPDAIELLSARAGGCNESGATV